MTDLERLRHSASHVLATAISKIWPEAQFAAGPGSLIGEMELIDDSPRTANAVAKSPSRLAQIDRRRFHFLVQQTPHFATHVMKILANRLRHMNAVTAVR